MSSHNSRGEEFGVQTNVEPQHCTGWRDISSAERDEDTYILASVNGKVWFQCSWAEEDQCWVTFNRYYEDDRHPKLMPPAPREFRPTLWVPLPSSEEQPQCLPGSEANTAEGNPATDELNLNPLPPDIKEWIEELRRSAERPNSGDVGGTAWILSDEGRKTRDRDRLRLAALLSLARDVGCCDGCGSTRTQASLEADGYRSCCPERKMLSAKEWSKRAVKAESERDEARRERAHYSEAYREARDDAIARERRAKSAEKQLAEAVGVLKPFAKAAEPIASDSAEEWNLDGWMLAFEALTFGQFRAAAAVFAQHQSPQSSKGAEDEK